MVRARGMLLYPFAVVCASLADLDQAQKTLGDMAPTYFVAVAGIVAAFFGAQCIIQRNDRQRSHNSQDITHISLG